MSTAIIINSTTTGGKSVAKSVGDINPNASAADLKQLAQKITALTTNTYDSTVRVDKTEISDGTYYDIVLTVADDPAPVHATFANDTVTFDVSENDPTTDLILAFPHITFIPTVNNMNIPADAFELEWHYLYPLPTLLVMFDRQIQGGVVTPTLAMYAYNDSEVPIDGYHTTVTIKAGSYNGLNWNAKTINVAIHD